MPFDVGRGQCCGADAPHPTSFMLFMYNLINAVFTAGAFPILVPPSPDAGALLGAWDHPHAPKANIRLLFLCQSNPDHLPFITA